MIVTTVKTKGFRFQPPPWAKILRDVEGAEGVILRWLVVEGQAMNTDNLARDEFEKEAVVALKWQAVS